MSAIESVAVNVNDDVTGLDWTVVDIMALARLIAVVALGQSHHAARIIAALEPDEPAIRHVDLIADAKRQMRIRGVTGDQRQVSRVHRDGFLFECMSWIVARQEGDERTFLKDPHIDATSHGLDGLIVRLHDTDPVVLSATICEDKCTSMPRRRFREEVMATFGDHHHNKRGRDLVANAAALIREGGLNGTDATIAAARVLDRDARIYRAALTTEPLPGNARARMFRGYDALDGIGQPQRIGATMIIDGDLRDWFQNLADAVSEALDGFTDDLDVGVVGEDEDV